jgi:hypothetical protein
MHVMSKRFIINKVIVSLIALFFCAIPTGRLSVSDIFAGKPEAEPDFIVLEDFEGYEIGEFPPDWDAKKDDKKHVYVVREENGNKYLAADDNGESNIIAKKIRWNLDKYPYLSFKWRARAIPKGADERYGESVDSGAGLYVTYKKTMIFIPHSVKFVWSSTQPLGAAMRRSGTGKPWMVVAESGEENVGEWRTYVYDLREIWKQTFKGKTPNKPLGIGILSDSNDTKDKAYCDYDDIIALKRAEVTSGISQYLDAE